MLFRQAQIEDLEAIWQIILYAKETMRQRGSQQWQDGYPFRETIEQDIAHHYAYVVEETGEIMAYVAISRDGEPTYQKIEGAWLNDAPYIVGHRIAVSEKAKGKGQRFRGLYHTTGGRNGNNSRYSLYKGGY